MVEKGRREYNAKYLFSTITVQKITYFFFVICNTYMKTYRKNSLK